MDKSRIERAARDSLQLSNYHKEIFTPEQVEAITNAIVAAITSYNNQEKP